MSGLPPIADSVLPATVRQASAEDKRAYKAALGFEQVMLGELLKAAPPLATGPHASSVNDGLAGALAAQGGVGLAQSLFAQIRSEEAAK